MDEMRKTKNRIPILVYIVGSGHSGSTLLDMLLSAHSKIFGVGELCSLSFGQIDKEICSCGRKALGCSFWSKILKGLKGTDKIPSLSVKRNIFASLFNIPEFRFRERKNSLSIDQYLKFNEKLYQKIVEVSGNRVLLDSSKEVERAEILARSNKLNLIFIHLIRDGRGVMWSYKKKYKKTIFPIFIWLLTNLKAEIIKRRNKNVKTIFLRYEDLADKPEKELERILKILGLSFEKQMLNFSTAPQHQIAGNRLRLRKDREIKKDSSWRENLSQFDLFLFYLIAGFLNKYYGY